MSYMCIIYGKTGSFFEAQRIVINGFQDGRRF